MRVIRAVFGVERGMIEGKEGVVVAVVVVTMVTAAAAFSLASFSASSFFSSSWAAM